MSSVSLFVYRAIMLRVLVQYIKIYRLFSFSGGTFLRGVQGNPNKFPILVQGDAVHGMWPI